MKFKFKAKSRKKAFRFRKKAKPEDDGEVVADFVVRPQAPEPVFSNAEILREAKDIVAIARARGWISDPEPAEVSN